MSEREDFIATLQACYFGDKNAFKKIIRVYEEKENRINKAIEYIKIHTRLSHFELEEILKGGNNE